jgi:16S rRNA (adenine1518-N6/adenine1519-N6)-dimethyltransferase
MDNFNFKKKYGQNFLKDYNIINKIVDGSLVDKDTLVIEIGPGGGALSEKIIPRCGYAILYEIDTSLQDYLEEKLKYDNYKIIFKDFLEANILEDIKDYKYSKMYVVANLPYYITTPIISKFINDKVFPDKMVIMVQREVADRLSASVGSKDYGSLTVFLNYYYAINKLIDVSRNCFVPQPNVDSAVVVMELKNDRLEVSNEELFHQIVRDSFQFKRKNIRNNLKNYDLNIISKVLEKYGYDLGVRAENLELEVFIDIANEIDKKNL